MSLKHHIVAFVLFTSFSLAISLVVDEALSSSLEKRSSALCRVGQSERIELENEVVRANGDLASCRSELEKAREQCEEEP